MEEWILFLFYKDKKNNINNKGKMCKIKALKDIFPYIKYDMNGNSGLITGIPVHKTYSARFV